jgi:hypothetical protein
MPDKAIDLLDEACANIRVQLDSRPERIDILERRKMQLETDIPLDVVLVLRALIVLFIAAPALTRLIWRLKSEGSTSALQFRGWGA